MSNKNLQKRSSKSINEKIVEATALALEDEGFYSVMATCKKKTDCDGCPYAYGDERGFLLCIFSVCPDHWDKYIKWLEEDDKNE